MLNIDWDEFTETQKRLVFQRPDLYQDHPAHVECIETHLSWVFLTNRFAYKIRKPIRYGKLNYTTVHSRLHDQMKELIQNRRLAEGLYYGLVPLTYSLEEGFKAEGSGKVVEWMIKMRRLPAEQMLEFKIKNNTLKDADIRTIVDRLAFFYLYQEGVLTDGELYLVRLENEAGFNHSLLSNPSYGLSFDMLSRLYRTQLRFLSIFGETLAERARKGHVIDGHGDLRPEHICIEPERPPTIFDCLHFDPELRKIDCVDELSFLSLECERIGAPQVDGLIFNRYCEVTKDRPMEPLRSFYKIYRSCMWARLAIERTRELEKNMWQKWIHRAKQYLGLAVQYSERIQPFIESKADLQPIH